MTGTNGRIALELIRRRMFNADSWAHVMTVLYTNANTKDFDEGTTMSILPKPHISPCVQCVKPTCMYFVPYCVLDLRCWKGKVVSGQRRPTATAANSRK
jgi:hypothetical protein